MWPPVYSVLYFDEITKNPVTCSLSDIGRKEKHFVASLQAGVLLFIKEAVRKSVNVGGWHGEKIKKKKCSGFFFITYL